MKTTDQMRSRQSVEHHGMTDALHQQLNDLLTSFAAQQGVNNALIAVESLDQSLRWVGASGEAHPDGALMQPTTPFWIASITKLFIAAAVFKLIEQGAVQLRDPVSSLLPESLVSGIHRLDGVDYSDQITVRHLLGHSSGLPDYLEERPEGQESLLERIGQQDHAWTSKDAVRIVRESLRPHFPPQPLGPGRQRIRYSDTNYQLLIELIETLRGKPLSDTFSEYFYQPLGLSNTFHPEQSASDKSYAMVWYGDTPLNVPLAMSSFRDLVSTADDQIRFMRGLIRGEVFDRQVTLDRMMGNWNRFGFSLNLASPSPPWPIEYGLGAMRFKIPRLLTPIKPVPAIVGHTGVSGSWLFYCPELKLVLAGTANQYSAAATPFRFVPRLLRVLGDARKQKVHG